MSLIFSRASSTFFSLWYLLTIRQVDFPKLLNSLLCASVDFLSFRNILSAILGWYRDPRPAQLLDTPASRVLDIPDIYLVIPPRTTLNVRILKPASIRSAWEKAWE